MPSLLIRPLYFLSVAVTGRSLAKLAQAQGVSVRARQMLLDGAMQEAPVLLRALRWTVRAETQPEVLHRGPAVTLSS